jgi:hypothetical protein
VSFGADFVLALLVLPAFAGGKVENGVVLIVLRSFGFWILSANIAATSLDSLHCVLHGGISNVKSAIVQRSAADFRCQIHHSQVDAEHVGAWIELQLPRTRFWRATS